MANFDGLNQKANTNATVWQILANVRNAYQALVTIRNALVLYQESSPGSVYRVAVNAFYTPEQRTELGQVASKMAALVEDLEANHAELVS